MNRPVSIILFEKIFFACIGLSIVAIAFGWDELVVTATSQSPGIADAVSTVMIVAIVIGIAIPILLWFFIARRASNLAKWIYVVLTAFSLFSLLSSLANPTAVRGVMAIAGAVTTLLQVWSTWLLFKPDAVAWLDSKGADRPGDPKTFD